jgi:hypothetical protein
MSFVVFGLREWTQRIAFDTRNLRNIKGGSLQKRHRLDFSLFEKKGFSKHT